MHNGCFPAVCVIRAVLSLLGLDVISVLAMEVSDDRCDDNSYVLESEFELRSKYHHTLCSCLCCFPPENMLRMNMWSLARWYSVWRFVNVCVYMCVVSAPAVCPQGSDVYQYRGTDPVQATICLLTVCTFPIMPVPLHCEIGLS